jgi:general secretion pathway protein H
VIPAPPLRSPFRRRDQRALTLIELLVTIALIGIVTTGVVVGSGAVVNSRMRGAASMITGAVRFAYTRASAVSRPNRLAFDLDQSTVTLEETNDTLLVEKNNATGGSEGSTPEEKAAQEYAARIIKGPQAPRARFSPVKALGFDADTSGGRSLGSGVKFRKIETGHSPDGQTSGRAYLYFWPGGQTERASIQLVRVGSEGLDEGISVLVSPLTARVRTLGGSKSMDPLRDDGSSSEREDRAF